METQRSFRAILWRTKLLNPTRSTALFPFDDALQILFYLLIGQGGNGNTNPGNQFHFKPPDGDDKQCVYQIAPAEGVEQIRQFFCDLPDRAVAGDYPVNANELGFPALALHIQDRIGIDENRLRPTSDWQTPPGGALQQQTADKMRGIHIQFLSGNA